MKKIAKLFFVLLTACVFSSSIDAFALHPSDENSILGDHEKFTKVYVTSDQIVVTPREILVYSPGRREILCATS